MDRPIQIGLVGYGKIARDQHAPALRRNPAFQLVAAADPIAQGGDIAIYPTLEAMLDACPDIEAVAVCTPPVARRALASAALARGKHVLLEKPPAASLSEVEALRQQAQSMGLTLFAAWHSRFAAAVAPARLVLAHRRLRYVKIDWREDVRHWHPGQAWIWRPGGLGVFDPGINALSIATAILPRPFFVTGADLHFPANCEAPIAADLAFADANGLAIIAGFDWLQTGPQTWDIVIETDEGRVELQQGGSRLIVDGVVLVDAADVEYPGVYQRFAELIASGASDVDVAPLRQVADAFLLGRRHVAAPFED
ncbi:MAG: Gfo/Idh/MocA family oxidoreductase [Pseudomonadota bacterium]|jgi:D-galactose 1-dehydrogenase